MSFLTFLKNILEFLNQPPFNTIVSHSWTPGKQSVILLDRIKYATHAL
jgi:hypothetical protein